MKERKERELEKSKSRRKRKSEEEFHIPESFKKRLIGFLVFVIGILAALAVISYSKYDENTLSRISFMEIFKKETYTATIYNWLGIAGAYLALFLVNNLFGYFSVLLPLVVIILGYVVFMKKELYRPLNFSVYALLLMVVLGASGGLLRYMFGKDRFSIVISGAVGDFIASIFYHTIGSVGASLLFFVALITVVFFILDSNILKTIAKLKILWEKIVERFKREREAVKVKEIAKKEKTISPQEEEFEEDELRRSIKREMEKIKKLKSGKDLTDEPVIKDTEINRPKIVKPVVKEKTVPETKNLDSILIKKPKKTDISETDINPENDNLLSGIEGKGEDDFIEEKLENYVQPGLDLLDDPSPEQVEIISDDELKRNGRLLQEKLLKFGIEIQDIKATPGPVVTLYELIPAPEVKLSKIESLQDDIALAMKAKGIRMIVPIPGKGTIGVEIPNSKSQIVTVKEILSSPEYNKSHKRLTVAFGKMIDGNIYVDDLSKMPHVLIAGATGSGKSVGINTIIASLLFRLHPSDLKFIMIDPKKIELSLYSKLRNHFIATSNDVNESIITSANNAVSVLKSVEMEMEQRYDKLANAGVRNIEAYNEKYKEGKLKNNDVIRHRKMPYIVVIIDELADLMITAKREIEDPIVRIAQMARAVGIHLIVATQRPSVDVITGLIKANFPVRVAYQVASKFDSRTILDMSGADQLLRNGDMLYMSSSSPKPIRIQNAYISTEECERIVDFISSQKGFSKPYLLPPVSGKKNGGRADMEDGYYDEFFPDACRLIIKLQNCSTSTLQRRLKLGYARAARIVDQMESVGIVGKNQGAKGREILVTEEELEEILVRLGF